MTSQVNHDLRMNVGMIAQDRALTVVHIIYVLCPMSISLQSNILYSSKTNFHSKRSVKAKEDIVASLVSGFPAFGTMLMADEHI